MRATIDYKNIEKFETAMRSWYIDNTKDESIKDQLKNALAVEVEYTGVGYFITYDSTLDFSVPRSTIDGPDFKSSNADDLCGTILFIKDGKIHFMEVFTYGHHMDDHIDDFEFDS